MKFRLLIIDDEKSVCNSLKRILEDKEREICTAIDTRTVWQLLEKKSFDLIILDYKLKETDGISLLGEIKEKHPDIMMIMLTAYGNVDLAVTAMKTGAYDFIQKNQEPDFIRFTVTRALDNLRLKKEVEELRSEYQLQQQLPEIISRSTQMRRTLDLAEEYAKTDVTVLLTGETGTGKNILGRYIHSKSPRFLKPYVSINCAAIPRELIESELFGYEKGAFTGADMKGKKGLFEQADGGTLFLDEIVELNPAVQSKLLHVIEKREFYKVGGIEPKSCDVRIIAATNADMEQVVSEKSFRMDLYYRLNVAQIRIPALRQRNEDIILLTKYFIEEFNCKFHKNVHKISPDAQRYLERAQWPGNVRELRNSVERAMLLKKNDILELSDFMENISVNTLNHLEADQSSLLSINLNGFRDGNVLQEAQRQIIQQVLDMTDQNRSKAAKLLGIPRTSLNFYIKKFGVS